MQSFFVVRAKAADLRARVSEFQERFASLLAYASATLHTHHAVSDSGRIALVAYSNEPDFHLYKTPDGSIAVVTGHTTQGAAIVQTGAQMALGVQVRNLPGRFSAVVFQPGLNRVAVANSVVRVDSVFLGENDQYEIVGTQASAIAHFLYGESRFEPDAMFSFLNAGFFGTDETAFAGIRCLPAASTWLLEDEKASIHTRHPAIRKAEHAPRRPSFRPPQSDVVREWQRGSSTTRKLRPA